MGGSALVLGGANCVFKDVEAALKIFTPEAVAACNNIGVRWEGHVDHWFSLHPNPSKDWVGMELALERRLRGGRNRPIVWSHISAKGVDKVMPDHGHGSTGLFAVLGMLRLGYDRIILAGVPMTQEGAHYNISEPWKQATRYYRGWLKRYEEIAPFVRSMSGWTREQFGVPTSDWLESSN